MSIQAITGHTFEATVKGAPTGRVGVIAVQLLDNEGAAAIARQTDGIIETPTGSGFYAVTLTAPEPLGQYTVMWDLGEITPSTTAVEELIVTAAVSTAGTGAPFGRAWGSFYRGPVNAPEFAGVDDRPQWVSSDDLVDGGTGRVKYNLLQQNIPEPPYDDGQPDWITTDPWDITRAA